jgi:hypothetical protein
MLSRAEFDAFLKLYGIPTSDEKYNQFKKSQSTSLANQQFIDLANQVKQKVDKPKYPDIIVGPGTEAGNKAAMDKYNKQLAAYNRQQAIIKSIQEGMAQKTKYYEQREKTKTTTTVPVNPTTQSDLNKLPDTYKSTTPEQEKAYRDRLEASYEKYKKSHHPVYDRPDPVVKKPNKIPNTHQHVNHNIMTLSEYRNIMLTQGMEVGQAQYKDYLKRFNLNNPTEYLQGQLEINAKERAASSLAKGKSIKQHQKEHSKSILDHMTNKNVPIPGQIQKVNPPAVIKLHNFQTPTPAHNEHHVDAHSINKEAQTMVGNPVYANSKPKIVSGPRQDNHLNPTPQPNAAASSGIQAGSAFKNVAVKPTQPAPQPAPKQPTKISFAPHKETFAEFRARTANQQPKPQQPQFVDQDAGDMIL